jgi:accessory colonization factor AcfC
MNRAPNKLHHLQGKRSSARKNILVFIVCKKMATIRINKPIKVDTIATWIAWKNLSMSRTACKEG